MANIDTLKGKLTNIANAIRQKTGKTALLDLDEMPPEILSIDSGGADVPNPDDPLLLVDWDGTLLYSYTAQEAQQISEFPEPPEQELLAFRGWTYPEVLAKTWLQNHPNGQLKVGAVYTTTDGQNHDYWRNSRLSAPQSIYKQKRGTLDITTGFSSYNSLETLNIPHGSTFVDVRAFSGCYSLKTIVIPPGVSSIASSVFANCYNLSEILLPPSVSGIATYAFQNCCSLYEIVIPENVTNIGNSAFDSCYNLLSIVLPANLLVIGQNTFQNCYCITQLDIPGLIEQLHVYAFRGCRELYDIVLRGTPALASVNVFSGCPQTQKIYVHRSDLSWFETATNWSAIYAEGKIVAAADYIDYLQSIGIDTTDFEGE